MSLIKVSRHVKNPALFAIGQQICKLRKEKGFSQESFANHIEMNRGYYGTIERGETNVTALNLLRIARGLQVPPGNLFPAEIHK